MSDKVNISDVEFLAAARQNIVIPTEQLEPPPGGFRGTDKNSGLFNTIPVQPRRNFIAAGNNIVITDSSKNSAIVIGGDRPASEASGLSGEGAMFADTIDVVAGRMSCNRELLDGSSVGNSFSCDAARIYVSQLTEVDKNFGLETGFIGDMPARSAIAMKADGVRIIGREGVKIVSGRSFAFKGHAGGNGETNSLGGPIQQLAPPIELIAGNTKTESGFLGIGPERRILQGIAKGENVRDALRDLFDIIDGLWASVFNMAIYNIFTFASYAINPWCPWYAGASSFACTRYLTDVLNPMWHMRAQKSFWQVNYTKASGNKYVVSPNVYST